MPFYINIADRRAPAVPRRARRLWRSSVLAFVMFLGAVFADFIFSGGRFSSLMISDAVSGYDAARSLVSNTAPLRR